MTDRARALIADARRSGRTFVDEAASKQILSIYGLATPRSVRIAGAGQLDAAMKGLSPPFVLKVISPDVIHKSDVGGVETGLADRPALLAAMNRMSERLHGEAFRIDAFLLEETAPPGHEVVIGGFRDPSFGPVIMFGLGGIFMEALHDVSFRICPISRIDAREMIGELRAAPVLSGARGGAVAPEGVLVDALLSIGGEGGLLPDLADELVELDINPIIVSNARAIAVDARFILSAGPVGA